MQVSVAEAKNKLTQLIAAVEKGEQVTICRHGKPIVDLVQTKSTDRPKRQFGTLKGKITIHDPDWARPMTDEEVDAFIEGRY